jgi:hypothetical protein
VECKKNWYYAIDSMICLIITDLKGLNCEDTFERQLRVKNVKYGKFHNWNIESEIKA